MAAAVAPVVIDMPPQYAALANARVLADACTEGLHDRRACELEDATNVAAYAVVIVSWESPAHTAANIEVGMRHGSHAEWVTRHVTFRTIDAERERWRSVGLIVATLVEQSGGETKKAAGVETPPAGAVDAADRFDGSRGSGGGEGPAASAGHAARWLFDGAFEVARGTVAGSGAWGGIVRATCQLGSTPLQATGSLRYEVQPQAGDGTVARVAIQWGWASAGIAVASELAGVPLRLEARFEPTVAWVHATAAGSASSPSGELVGVREGVGVTWWWARPVGLVVDAEAVETPPANVGVSATGAPPYQTVTKEEWFGWSTVVGFRVRVD